TKTNVFVSSHRRCSRQSSAASGFLLSPPSLSWLCLSLRSARALKEAMTLEVRVDDGEEGLAVLEWELLELLEASLESTARRRAARGLRPLAADELVDGDGEGVGQGREDVPRREGGALLVVGDHPMRDAGGGLELALGEAGGLTERSEALAEVSMKGGRGFL